MRHNDMLQRALKVYRVLYSPDEKGDWHRADGVTVEHDDCLFTLETEWLAEYRILERPELAIGQAVEITGLSISRAKFNRFGQVGTIAEIEGVRVRVAFPGVAETVEFLWGEVTPLNRT